MTRKRDCADERRIEQLRELGRLADELLVPADADQVLAAVGRELDRIGYLIPERYHSGGTIH